MDAPKGLLFLTIVEARDVPRMDLFSASDPFVKCGLGLMWFFLQPDPHLEGPARVSCIASPWSPALHDVYKALWWLPTL